MDTSTAEARIYIIDILKIIACFFVFRIHMGGGYCPLVLSAVPMFIFLTSYNYTRSCVHCKKLTLKNWYSPGHLLKKFVRLYIPYTVFALCQLILIIVLKAGYSAKNIALSILFGGFGPGNYYLVLMFQIILIYPLLFKLTKKYSSAIVVLCALFYLTYHIVMRFAFPDNPEDVTTFGGIINKWTVFGRIFLIECGIYYHLNSEKIKPWQFLILTLLDLFPLILQSTTTFQSFYIRGIPYNFLAIGISGLCIKYFGTVSFGKLNSFISYLGKATWQIFLFQQLYFWLIDLLKWEIGFTYFSFPICFIGGTLFYSAQKLITKLITRKT